MKHEQPITSNKVILEDQNLVKENSSATPTTSITTMDGEKNTLNIPSAPPLVAAEEEDFSNLYPTGALSGAVLSATYTVTEPAYHHYPIAEELPPSYEELEQHIAVATTQQQNTAESHEPLDSIGAAFDYDAFGNLVTTEERARMEEQQCRILEQIMREREAAASTSSSTASISGVANATTTPSQTVAQHLPSSTTVVSGSLAPQHPSRVIEVGSGQRITVHDQSKTREAIRSGTALLVECVSCSNWMQIADTATLMFCPCCQSVVPVIRQNAVRTREEAIRLTRDRQLAERLQNEDASEGTAAISGSATAVASESGRELTFSSWREYVTAIFSTSGGEEEQRSNRSSWANVLSYPAAARTQASSTSQSSANSATSSQPRELYTAHVIGNEELTEYGSNEETAGLLPARVADPQPNLLSCVEKSFSSVVSSLGKFGLSHSEEKEEIDEELLALTERDRLGREENTSTEYHRLLDYEES